MNEINSIDDNRSEWVVIGPLLGNTVSQRQIMSLGLSGSSHCITHSFNVNQSSGQSYKTEHNIATRLAPDHNRITRDCSTLQPLALDQEERPQQGPRSDQPVGGLAEHG